MLDQAAPLSARRSLYSTLPKEDAAFAEKWGGKIGLQVLKGNRAAAHDLVDQGILEHRQRSQSPFLATPLTEAGVDTLTANALENDHNISTIGDALEANVTKLVETPQLGPTRILGLLQALLRLAVRRVMEGEHR